MGMGLWKPLDSGCQEDKGEGRLVMWRKLWIMITLCPGMN
jgi:hypothetical protein